MKQRSTKQWLLPSSFCWFHESLIFRILCGDKFLQISQYLPKNPKIRENLFSWGTSSPSKVSAFEVLHHSCINRWYSCAFFEDPNQYKGLLSLSIWSLDILARIRIWDESIHTLKCMADYRFGEQNSQEVQPNISKRRHQK